MKKFSLVSILVSVLTIISLAALSQISQLTPNISLEEKSTCNIVYINNTQFIYGTCNYYYNYTYCSNVSGPNTGCSLQQQINNLSCKNGEQIINVNETICKPNNEFIITINQNNAILKKQIDFSDWGACIYNEENNCLIVTCQSIYDGANDGKFHGCKSGTSCQKFEICENSVRTFYKNSKNEFVQEDPTFHLNKLPLKEVGQ